MLWFVIGGIRIRTYSSDSKDLALHHVVITQFSLRHHQAPVEGRMRKEGKEKGDR